MSDTEIKISDDIRLTGTIETEFVIKPPESAERIEYQVKSKDSLGSSPGKRLFDKSFINQVLNNVPHSVNRFGGYTDSWAEIDWFHEGELIMSYRNGKHTITEKMRLLMHDYVNRLDCNQL